MTPDLLDELRELDPVDRATLHVPDALLRPPPRRRSPLLGGAALVAAAAITAVLVSGGDDRLSLAERAYGATTGPGVIHWVADVTTFTNGKRGQIQRVEGWRQGGVTHMLRYEFTHGKPRLTSDTRTTPAGSRTWTSGSDDYWDGPARSRRDLASEGDPLDAFRFAYRTGRLQNVAANRYRAELAGRSERRRGGSYSVTYVLDPTSGHPRRVVFDAHARGRAPRGVMVYRISTYRRLPDTAASRAKLALLRHPGAGPSNIRAEDHFGVLTTGRPPSAGDAKLIAPMGRHMRKFRLDVTGARAVGPRVYLVPGRGYLCVLAVIDRPGSRSSGVGGGCQTVKKALASGVGVGGPASGQWLAVADDVTAVRARVRGRGWRTIPTRNNAVNLPFATIQKRLVR